MTTLKQNRTKYFQFWKIGIKNISAEFIMPNFIKISNNYTINTKNNSKRVSINKFSLLIRLSHFFIHFIHPKTDF